NAESDDEQHGKDRVAEPRTVEVDLRHAAAAHARRMREKGAAATGGSGPRSERAGREGRAELQQRLDGTDGCTSVAIHGGAAKPERNARRRVPVDGGKFLPLPAADAVGGHAFRRHARLVAGTR